MPALMDSESVQRVWGMGNTKDCTSASHHRNENVGPHKTCPETSHDAYARPRWKQPTCPSAADASPDFMHPHYGP